MSVLEPGTGSRRRRPRNGRRSRGVYWRRRALALLALAVPVAALAFLISGAAGDGDDARTAAGAQDGARQAPPPPPELPRGGRRIFPDFRVVGFYGNPREEQLGALGIGTPAEMRRRLVSQMRGYRRETRPVLPMYELISTIVSATPGENGDYTIHMPNSMIRRYLRAAREAKALLVLDIQPGQADFLSETRRLRRWLREPDVGIALDPEWRMAPGEVPGQVIGSVTAQEVNRVSAYVADIVRRHRLPEKLFLVHQFTPDMIEGKEQVRRRPGLAVTMNVDGFGSQAQKLDKWRAFTSEAVRFHDGFKLFYEEDTDLMSPGEVMRMRPRPDLVVYE
jgi:hypothetical protein